MVSIGASQALDPGSIPGWRKVFLFFQENAFDTALQKSTPVCPN